MQEPGKALSLDTLTSSASLGHLLTVLSAPALSHPEVLGGTTGVQPGAGSSVWTQKVSRERLTQVAA